MRSDSYFLRCASTLTLYVETRLLFYMMRLDSYFIRADSTLTLCNALYVCHDEVLLLHSATPGTRAICIRPRACHGGARSNGCLSPCGKSVAGGVVEARDGGPSPLHGRVVLQKPPGSAVLLRAPGARLTRLRRRRARSRPRLGRVGGRLASHPQCNAARRGRVSHVSASE